MSAKVRNKLSEPRTAKNYTKTKYLAQRKGFVRLQLANTSTKSPDWSVIPVRVYYSAQIFLIGAEFTWVYAHTFGSLREQVTTQA